MSSTFSIRQNSAFDQVKGKSKNFDSCYEALQDLIPEMSVTYPGQRCSCCPYNFHIDLDFLSCLDDHGKSRIYNTRKFSRKETTNFQTLPQLSHHSSSTPRDKSKHQTKNLHQSDLYPAGEIQFELEYDPTVRKNPPYLKSYEYGTTSMNRFSTSKHSSSSVTGRHIPSPSSSVNPGLSPSLRAASAPSLKKERNPTDSCLRYRSEAELYLDGVNNADQKRYKSMNCSIGQLNKNFYQSWENLETPAVETRRHTGTVSGKSNRTSTKPRRHTEVFSKTASLESESFSEKITKKSHYSSMSEGVKIKEMKPQILQNGASVHLTLTQSVPQRFEQVTQSAAQRFEHVPVSEDLSSQQSTQDLVLVSNQYLRNLERQVKLLSQLQTEVTNIREQNKILIERQQDNIAGRFQDCSQKNFQYKNAEQVHNISSRTPGDSFSNLKLNGSTEDDRYHSSCSRTVATQTNITWKNEMMFTDSGTKELHRWRSERDMQLKSANKQFRSVAVGERGVTEESPDLISTETLIEDTSEQKIQENDDLCVKDSSSQNMLENSAPEELGDYVEIQEEKQFRNENVNKENAVDFNAPHNLKENLAKMPDGNNLILVEEGLKHSKEDDVGILEESKLKSFAVDIVNVAINLAKQQLMTDVSSQEMSVTEKNSLDTTQTQLDENIEECNEVVDEKLSLKSEGAKLNCSDLINLDLSEGIENNTQIIKTDFMQNDDEEIDRMVINNEKLLSESVNADLPNLQKNDDLNITAVKMRSQNDLDQFEDQLENVLEQLGSAEVITIRSDGKNIDDALSSHTHETDSENSVSLETLEDVESGTLKKKPLESISEQSLTNDEDLRPEVHPVLAMREQVDNEKSVKIEVVFDVQESLNKGSQRENNLPSESAVTEKKDLIDTEDQVSKSSGSLISSRSSAMEQDMDVTIRELQDCTQSDTIRKRLTSLSPPVSDTTADSKNLSKEVLIISESSRSVTSRNDDHHVIVCDDNNKHDNDDNADDNGKVSSNLTQQLNSDPAENTKMQLDSNASKLEAEQSQQETVESEDIGTFEANQDEDSMKHMDDHSEYSARDSIIGNEENSSLFDGTLDSVADSVEDKEYEELNDEEITEDIPASEKEFEITEELHAACSMYSRWITDPTSVSPPVLIQRPFPHPKAISGTYLPHKSEIQEGCLKLELARDFVQRHWFYIAGRKNSTSEDVLKFLSSIENLSENIREPLINMQDSDGNTAFHYAVSHGNFNVMGTLLDTGSSVVNIENHAGYSALLLASLLVIETNSQKNLLQKLFNTGNVNAKSSSSEQSALMLAASHGSLITVLLLLEGGADVNARDEDGSTALMCASEHGHKKIVQALLAVPECDSSVTDVDGSSAFSIAMEEGHKEICDIIYSHMTKNDN